jgi:uncharacterized DUF497 family protein
MYRYEWHSQKAANNLKKHSISFDEASTVFSDPLACIFDDLDHSENEAREIIIGHSIAGRLIICIFAEYKPGIIRIISARQVTNKEREDYEKSQR